jgi:hypothetical protein
MKTLALYVKPAGTKVTLRLTPNEQVSGYTVFVQKWVNGKKQSVATWFPDQLEAPDGSSTVLAQCEGYDFILKANIAGTPDTAIVDPVLSFDDVAVYTEKVHLPISEGHVVSREWSIVIP